MDMQSLEGLLGLPAEAVEVRTMLRQLGVTDPPQLSAGDAKAYVEVKDLGLYLVFTDEVLFRNIEGASIGNSPLILTNITAYCSPISEYEAYKGALPLGIVQSDTPDAARGKMGGPGLFNDRLKLERWTVNGNWVFVKYDRGMTSIERLSLQAPDA